MKTNIITYLAKYLHSQALVELFNNMELTRGELTEVESDGVWW